MTKKTQTKLPVAAEMDQVVAEAKLPKTISAHPRRSVYEWFVRNGMTEKSKEEGCQEAFDHAVSENGKIKRGVKIGSAEHAAALAGAAIWRLKNPSATKGGPGRGQGRKAADGQTDFVRMSVNVRPDQHEAFKAFGGSLWLRRQIDVQSKFSAAKNT